MLSEKLKRFKIINFRPIPYLLISLVIGIILAVYLNLFYSLIILSIIYSFVISLCICNKKFYIILFLSLIFLSFGFFSSYISLKKANNDDFKNDVIIEGRIKKIEENDTNYIIYLDDISVDNEKKSGNIYLNLNKDFTENIELKQGYIINYKGYIIRSKIEVKVSSSLLFYKNNIRYYSGASQNISLKNGKIKFKEIIINKFKEILDSKLSADFRAVCLGMVFGDLEGLDEESYTYYKASGITHIFSISGLHVSVLAGFIIFICRLLKLSRKIQLIIVTIILSLYTYICGYSPTVIRASLMIIIYLISVCLHKNNDGLTTMCLSALIILLFKPFYMFEISFMMSYTAITGILFLNKAFNKMFIKLPKHIRNLISMSLSVNIAMLPVIALFFKKVSIYYLIANLFIIPLSSLLYIVLLIIFVLVLISPIFKLLIIIPSFIIKIINYICQFTASLPFSFIPIDFDIKLLLPYFFILIFASEFIILKKKFKMITILSSIFVYITIIIMSIIPLYSKNNTISNMNYNNILIIKSNKEYYIILNKINDKVIEDLKYMKMSSNIKNEIIITSNLCDYSSLKNEYDMKVIDEFEIYNLNDNLNIIYDNNCFYIINKNNLFIYGNINDEILKDNDYDLNNYEKIYIINTQKNDTNNYEDYKSIIIYSSYDNFTIKLDYDNISN